MEYTPSKKFQAWASSFAGCDGGNLSGPIWFCGIEHGGEFPLNEAALKPEYGPWQYEGDALQKTGAQYDQYDQKTLKLFSVLLGGKCNQHQRMAKERNAFSSKGDVFKFNLYPAAFPNTKDDKWDESAFKVTGIPTKEYYRIECQRDRFKKFRHLSTVQHKATVRLIICTGVTHISEFLAPGGSNSLLSGHFKIPS